MFFAPHYIYGEIVVGGGACAGTIGMNVSIPVPMVFHSFGGRMQALFGDHHVHRLAGVRFNTRLKTALFRWPRGGIDSAQFILQACA